jgi:hypothetical protein
LALIGALGAATPGALAYLEARDAKQENAATDTGAKQEMAASQIYVEDLAEEMEDRWEELWKKTVELEAEKKYLQRRIRDLEARHRIRPERHEPVSAIREMPPPPPKPKPKRPESDDPRIQRKIDGYDWGQRKQ